MPHTDALAQLPCDPINAPTHALTHTRLRHTELNLKAISKIIKKHDKVGLSFRHTKKTFDEFTQSKVSVDMGNVCVCHMFVKTFGISSQGYMQREIGAKIEEDYARLHEDLLNYDRQRALEKLRVNGDVMDPPMKQSDTFTLGCLVGCMLPLLFYCFLAVVSGHDVTASPKWQLIWLHFRMTFLCILHATLWAWNIYVFKAFKINYCLIFDITPGSQMHYNTLLKLCAAATLWTLGWLTLSLQKLVDESSSVPQYAWLNALDPFFQCSSPPPCSGFCSFKKCIVLLFQTSKLTICAWMQCPADWLCCPSSLSSSCPCHLQFLALAG